MRINLQGIWEFHMGSNQYQLERNHSSFHPVLNEKKETEGKITSRNELITDIEFNDTILLPSTTEISEKGEMQIDSEQRAHLSRKRPFTGKCYYRKIITLPKDMEGMRLKLILERTKFTEVYLDGTLVSTSHETLMRQEHILSDCVKSSENELLIVVDNDLQSYEDFPNCLYNGHQFTEHTQTNWNGILGEIYLESIADVKIQNVKIQSIAESSKIRVDVVLNNLNQEKELSFLCRIPELGLTKRENFIHKPGSHVLHLELIHDVLLWDEFQPQLYKMEFQVLQQDKVLEQRIETVGFREISVKERNMFINGNRCFLRGTIDCAIYPLTGAAPMEMNEWKRIISIIKEYGLNHLRFHSWCPPEAAFQAADEAGVYLQIELPLFAAGFYEADKVLTSYIYDQSQKLIEMYGNHPSFLMFALGNEMTGDISAYNRVLKYLKSIRSDILYSQGSNNFLETPKCCEEDQYWITMRTSESGDNIRASFSHGDLPLGHVQTSLKQGTMTDYSNALEKSKIPLISHEIGQFETYPDPDEWNKYTGVTYSTALEQWKERMNRKGNLELAEQYFRCSGALAIQCYKEDMEAILRTEGMSGFQLLSLQDFPGQGTALVGVLNSFLDTKGLISPEKWRESCDRRVIYAKFPSYVYQDTEHILLEVGICNFSNTDIINEDLEVHITNSNEELRCSNHIVSAPKGKNTCIAHIKFEAIQTNLPLSCTLKLRCGEIVNEYPLWIYPSETKAIETKAIELEPGTERTKVVSALDEEALSWLREGNTVVLFSDQIEHSIEAAFPTDFWSYPMFQGICESKQMKTAPGTMGLVIDSNHDALKYFPTEEYSSWQWQQIVTKAKPVILDEELKECKMIVEVIDNFERGHRLGLLYEMEYMEGHLIVCALDAVKYIEIPEIKWLYYSVLHYASTMQ